MIEQACGERKSVSTPTYLAGDGMYEEIRFIRRYEGITSIENSLIHYPQGFLEAIALEYIFRSHRT